MASSRGYFLGQIIDDLDSIAHQVENRARLGYLDLNRMLEDFFKDVLNIILDADFRNLNDERSNEPGLDLGSAKLGMGVQVSSRVTSQKVNDTLRKITPEQQAEFSKIYILAIGEKQGTYTFDESKASDVGFKLDHIWDITELCRRATSLSLVKLQELHGIVTTEVARVKVELELPRSDGSYPTGLDDYIEQVGRPTHSDGSIFYASESGGSIYDRQEDAEADLKGLANALATLPRISREFYHLLVSKREEPRFGYGSYSYRANCDLIQRISKYPDTEGELRFLADRRFIAYDDPDDQLTSAYWRILLPTGTRRSSFDEAFFAFVDEASVDLKKVLVNLDFSPFGVAVEGQRSNIVGP